MTPHVASQILAALCPKRTIAKNWRRGPINLRYRYHHAIEDNGLGPRITATDLHDPCQGVFETESERERMPEIVRIIACRFSEYSDDVSSTAWDVTVDPSMRPDWLVNAAKAGAEG